MLQFAVSASYHLCLMFLPSFRAIGAGRGGVWLSEYGDEACGCRNMGMRRRGGWSVRVITPAVRRSIALLCRTPGSKSSLYAYPCMLLHLRRINMYTCQIASQCQSKSMLTLQTKGPKHLHCSTQEPQRTSSPLTTPTGFAYPLNNSHELEKSATSMEQQTNKGTSHISRT